jgi:hypothetical protein
VFEKKYYHIHTREMLVIYTAFYKYHMCLLVLKLNLTKLPMDESCFNKIQIFQFIRPIMTNNST